MAGEAISEAISYKLGLKISKELGIPNGKNLVESSMVGIDHFPQYKYVPRAVKWVEKNGIQSAFDLYMESPKKFMDKIRA